MPPRSPAPARISPEEMRDLASQVALAIEGNGLGKEIHAIREAMQRLELQSASDHKLVENHQQALYGDAETPGLLEQVRQLVRDFGTLKMMGKVAAGALITFLVTFGIYMVVTHPLP